MAPNPLGTPHRGKLLVLTPGLGAVATTFIAGVEAVRRGFAKPFGSLSQMQTVRLGPRSEQRNPLIRDFFDLAPLDDLEFGAWDVFDDDGYQAAERANVLNGEHLSLVKGFLQSIPPHAGGVSEGLCSSVGRPKRKSRSQQTGPRGAVARGHPPATRKNVRGPSCDGLVRINRGVYAPVSLSRIDTALRAREWSKMTRRSRPSQLYAYAAICEGVPYANGAPNLSADLPALEVLAEERGVPIAGKDFKTGQTLMKTILAPGMKARMLGINGWFSTNILGNRDGEVLDDHESFKAKELTKAGVLDTILQPEVYEDLYSDLYHKVRINYYPPRGDEKEGWDNIDIFGWLGYPMQIKVNFLCRDSILAAPIVLDLALFLDLAQRSGRGGMQEWLSFYFKSPQIKEGHVPEHDLFIQHFRLKNTLRVLAGEEPLTHLSENYVLSENLELL